MYEDAREAVLGLWKIRGVQNSATMNNIIIDTTYNNGGMLYYIISIIIIIFVFLTLMMNGLSGAILFIHHIPFSLNYKN